MNALHGLGGSLLILAVSGFSVLAADDVVQKRGDKEAAKGVEVATIYKVGHVIGMPVRDPAGKDLGKIEDLVVELHSGDVRYAALSYGGIAGIGDKLFAIPWDALTFKYGEKDRYFTLNDTQERLKNAPGFDKNHWPDMGAKGWSSDVDKFYSQNRRAGERARREGKPAVDEAYQLAYRASQARGMAVKNRGGEDLGKVEELVMDLSSGQVRYAALSFGGFLGLGDKLFAIPWSAFRLSPGVKDRHLVLSVNPEKLKAAPGFDKDHWPDTANPRWSRELDEFYEIRRTGATEPKSE